MTVLKKGKGRPGINIMCINDGNVFDTISKASEYYKIPQASISRQLMGNRKTVGGFHFVKILGNLSDEELKKIQKEELKKVYNIG